MVMSVNNHYAWGNCPTPPSSTDSSTKIATTAWVGPHIVTKYHSGSNWYRVWSDGWVEQGGDMSTNGTVTLLKTMSDATYYVDVTWNGGKSAYFYPSDGYVRNRTTTAFSTSLTSNSGNVKGLCWEVRGYGA